MDKLFFMIRISFILTFSFCGLAYSQDNSTFSVEVDKVITKYTVIQKSKPRTYRLKEFVHIDCGTDDEKYSLGGNSEDIGRIHFDRTYIQGADTTGWSFENRYFYYLINIDDVTDCIMRFSDTDNVKRYFKVIINDEYCYEILHDAESSEDQPGGWKDFYIKIPKKALKTGKNKIMFDHRNLPERSPAISDIWIYEIIK